jgi:hypothetical protein
VTDAIAIGNFANADYDRATAVGPSADAGGNNSTAYGYSSNASAANSASFGDSSDATGDRSVAFGSLAQATANDTTAVGISANASAYSAIAFGDNTVANAVYSTAVGARALASGVSAVAMGGAGSQADAANATANNAIAIGVKTLASGVDSVAIGNRATATDVGQFAYASGYFAAVGDAQTSMYVLRNQTTNATQTELFTNGSSADISVASDSTVFFRASIVARRTDADNESAAYIIEGCIDNNAGTTALVGGLGTKTIIAEDTTAWDVTITADNTNNGINILVTGEASKTIRWVARVETTTVAG